MLRLILILNIMLLNVSASVKYLTVADIVGKYNNYNNQYICVKGGVFYKEGLDLLISDNSLKEMSFLEIKLRNKKDKQLFIDNCTVKICNITTCGYLSNDGTLHQERLIVDKYK